MFIFNESLVKLRMKTLLEQNYQATLNNFIGF